MPFGVKTMSEQRSSLVEEIRAGDFSISALCRRYGVSRPTAYKWLRRSESGGSFESLSRAPLRSPNRTNKKTEDLILSARKRHPQWGGRKLKSFLEREQKTRMPSASTITAILHRHGLVSREASLAATPCKRFERENPNDLWQTDFKGHFAMSNGKRCHPLTVIDDMSRYNLCISAKHNERLPGVLDSFVALFEEYGLPLAVLCDNGAPWGTSACLGGYTKFEVFLLDHGVLPIHGRPLHPQTQGKCERFHRTLKRELLNNVTVRNLTCAQKLFDGFRKEYNEIRPHCALNYAVPNDKYVKSVRKMPARIYEWEYPSGIDVRKVKNGYVNFKHINFYFSEAFEGKSVALFYEPKEDMLEIVYRNFSIARISMKEKCFISKNIMQKGELFL